MTVDHLTVSFLSFFLMRRSILIFRLFALFALCYLVSYCSLVLCSYFRFISFVLKKKLSNDRYDTNLLEFMSLKLIPFLLVW